MAAAAFGEPLWPDSGAWPLFRAAARMPSVPCPEAAAMKEAFAAATMRPAVGAAGVAGGELLRGRQHLPAAPSPIPGPSRPPTADVSLPSSSTFVVVNQHGLPPGAPRPRPVEPSSTAPTPRGAAPAPPSVTVATPPPPKDREEAELTATFRRLDQLERQQALSPQQVQRLGLLRHCAAAVDRDLQGCRAALAATLLEAVCLKRTQRGAAAEAANFSDCAPELRSLLRSLAQ